MTANEANADHTVPDRHARSRAVRFEPHYWLLGAAMLLGLAIRATIVFGPIDVIWHDEIFQDMEQAHRLVFGSAVIPWEYVVGMRSWLLPALIAPVMEVASWFGTNPLFYVDTLRFLSAVLSLSVIVTGFFIAKRAAGPFWAIVTALLCAIWYQLLFFTPSFVGEVLAAYLTFPAVALAARADEDTEGRYAIPIGLLLGLAFCLRFQMAPALLVVAVWYGRTEWRRRWLPLALAGLAVVVPILGTLDYVTLGTPFQSIWLNYEYNVVRGVANHFGEKPYYYYVLELAWPRDAYVIPLAVLVILGALRAPLLALTACMVLLFHSLIAHKEYRFVCFTAMALPILMGLGLAVAAEFGARKWGAIAAWAAAATGIVYIGIFSWFGANDVYVRLPIGGILKAYLAAHDAPDVCGLGADLHWSVSGGYTFFNRDIPLYYSVFEPPTKLILKGRMVAQFPGAEFFQHTAAFNYLIVQNENPVEGYQAVACFSSGPWGPPATCLLHRPGGCG